MKTTPPSSKAFSQLIKPALGGFTGSDSRRLSSAFFRVVNQLWLKRKCQAQTERELPKIREGNDLLKQQAKLIRTALKYIEQAILLHRERAEDLQVLEAQQLLSAAAEDMQWMGQSLGAHIIRPSLRTSRERARAKTARLDNSGQLKWWLQPLSDTALATIAIDQCAVWLSSVPTRTGKFLSAYAQSKIIHQLFESAMPFSVSQNAILKALKRRSNHTKRHQV
jgi:hypothetical protein